MRPALETGHILRAGYHLVVTAIATAARVGIPRHCGRRVRLRPGWAFDEISGQTLFVRRSRHGKTATETVRD